MPGIWSDIVDAFSPGGVRGQQHQRFEQQQQEQQEQYRAQKADEEHMAIMQAAGALPIHAGMVQRPTFDPGVMLGTSPTGDLPAGVPGAQTTIPPSNGTYLDKADMSRASKWKDAFGDLIQHEVPTSEEQQQRKTYMDYAAAMNPARQQAQRVQDQEQAARASSVAAGTAAGAETGRQASLNTARQQYGTALPEGSGVGAGQKFLPEELPGVVAGVTQATGLPAQLQQAKIARASQALGSVTTPGAYQIIYNGIRDPQIQSLFDAPADFDPIKSPTRARMVNMKPEDQQKTSQMLTMSPGDWQSKVDSAFPPSGPTAPQNKAATILMRGYVSRGEFDKADALLEKGLAQQGATTTAVATEKAKEPTELAIAATNRAATESFQKATQLREELGRSYTQNNAELDKLGNPVEQTAQKVGDLKSLMAEGSPQAWANIPAKLLSVTVGGTGSGLRMSTPLLDQELGGAGKWAQLQGQLQQWSLDPKSATKISDTQKNEIRSIINVLDSKAQSKQGVMDQARQDLIAAPDVNTHRQVVLGAHQKLSAIDSGAGAGGKPVPPAVKTLLSAPNVGPGRHTLSDGTIWIKGADGSIVGQ